MPQYIFYNPVTDKYIEIFMGMNSEHIYIDKDGQKWDRVWCIPQTADKLNINPFSQKDFINKTNKRGKLDDIWNRSKELSEKRKDKEGFDPIKEKYIKNWEKLRKKEYPEKRVSKAKQKLSKLGVVVED